MAFTLKLWIESLKYSNLTLCSSFFCGVLLLNIVTYLHLLPGHQKRVNNEAFWVILLRDWKTYLYLFSKLLLTTVHQSRLNHMTLYQIIMLIAERISRDCFLFVIAAVMCCYYLFLFFVNACCETYNGFDIVTISNHLSDYMISLSRFTTHKKRKKPFSWKNVAQIAFFSCSNDWHQTFKMSTV